MLSLLLMLLGSVLLILSIGIFVLFMLSGGFRRSASSPRVLIISGIAGVLMIGLSIAASIYGFFVLRVAALILIPILFWGLVILGVRMFEGVKLREYIKRERVKPFLRLFLRIGIVVSVLLVLDSMGLWIYLSYRGLWNLPAFTELLILLLLLEGTLIGAGGAFMFYGYSEYGLMRQAALWPTLADDHVRGWKERRLSQQKWGFTMLIAGSLLIFFGLLVSVLTSV